jgi:hypothetical protein
MRRRDFIADLAGDPRHRIAIQTRRAKVSG